MSSIVKSAATVAAGAVAGNISKSASKRALKAQARQDAKMKKRRGAGWEPAPTDLLPSVNKRGKGCRRFKVVLSYEGAGFHGWMQQFPPGQAPLRTIEGVVQTSFRQAIGQRVRVHPAGRTDAGVNATGQVCQFDAETTEDTQPMAQRINEHLPPDCRVRSIEHVPQSFTAMGCLRRYTPPSRSRLTVIGAEWPAPPRCSDGTQVALQRTRIAAFSAAEESTTPVGSAPGMVERARRRRAAAIILPHF